MIITRRRVALAALLLVGATPAAHVSASPGRQLVHRSTVTVAGMRTSAAVTQAPGNGPTVALPRRARVVFTVPQETRVLPFDLTMPRGAGRYVAFYLPLARWGWVDMADPGSSRRWPAQLMLGDGVPWPTLGPGSRYTMLVALDRAAKVPMPFPMHVVSVRPASFRASAVVAPVPLLTQPAAAALGSTPNRLGRALFTTTAVVVDWRDYLSPTGDTEGDACPGATETDAFTCNGGDVGYTSSISASPGLVGGPVQVVIGTGYDQAVEGAVLAAYATTAPVPFDAVTVMGFALDPR